MAERELSQKEQEAIRQMREMSTRSQASQNSGRMPPSPEFVRLRNDNIPNSNTKFMTENEPLHREIKDTANKAITPTQKGIGVPFLDSIFKDGDSTLIIGLLLLLMSEKSDKILLFALVYILL